MIRHPEHSIAITSSAGQSVFFTLEDYRALADSLSLYIYLIDPADHRILYRNHALRERFGENNLALPCYKDLVGRDTPCPSCPMRTRDAHGKLLPVEVTQVDGVCLLAQASPLRWDGRDAYMINCVDITLRKKMEEQLRISAEESTIVIHQSGKKVLRYDIAADAAENMLDQTPVFGLSGRIEHFGDTLVRQHLLSEESLAVYRAFLDRIRCGEPEGSCDVLMNVSDGAQRWFHQDYALVYDKNNLPSHAVISVYDNTEMRQREIAYQRWQNTLSALLTHSTPYLECNLTRGTVECSENLSVSVPDGCRPTLDDYTDYALKHLVARVDLAAYRSFFNREHMLGQFFSGVTELSLDYRGSPDGAQTGILRWYRINSQMVEHPFSKDVMAFISFNDIDAEVREREHLTDIASHDSLTGLLNRLTMHQRTEEIFAASGHDCFALFVVDLDNFKRINDTLGHQSGDEALLCAAKALRHTFRGGDLVARLGGDEFMVLMCGHAVPAVVREKAAAMLQNLHNQIGGLSVTASAGIALFSGSGASYEQLYRLADEALYRAKRAGKDSFVIWGD